jgi:kynureninase
MDTPNQVAGTIGRFTPEQLCASPNELAPHYDRFDVANRLLLTGHSHQAWPDVAFDAQLQAWTDAATYVDDKWEHAFARADRVRAGYARLLNQRKRKECRHCIVEMI